MPGEEAVSGDCRGSWCSGGAGVTKHHEQVSDARVLSRRAMAGRSMVRMGSPG